jgi:hypothetical protein
MKKCILLLAFITLQLAPVFTQKIKPFTTPEAAGFSSEWLKKAAVHRHRQELTVGGGAFATFYWADPKEKNSAAFLPAVTKRHTQ